MSFLLAGLLLAGDWLLAEAVAGEPRLARSNSRKSGTLELNDDINTG